MAEINFMNMVLTDKEKVISLVSNAIASYSLYRERDALPENLSLIDFILKTIPTDLKPIISMELVDEIFECVSKTRMDDS